MSSEAAPRARLASEPVLASELAGAASATVEIGRAGDDVIARGADVVIALGGNLDGAEAIHDRFLAAASALEHALSSAPVRLSPVYESEPLGPIAEQPRFLNAALALILARPLSGLSLLHEILAIEARLGRVRARAVAQGPRTIDLDLLFAGDAIICAPGLRLPHPRLAERAFVLQPLADLMGGHWVMPGLARTVASCLDAPALACQRAGLTPYVRSRAAAGGYSRGA